MHPRVLQIAEPGAPMPPRHCPSTLPPLHQATCASLQPPAIREARLPLAMAMGETAATALCSCSGSMHKEVAQGHCGASMSKSFLLAVAAPEVHAVLKEQSCSHSQSRFSLSAPRPNALAGRQRSGHQPPRVQGGEEMLLWGPSSPAVLPQVSPPPCSRFKLYSFRWPPPTTQNPLSACQPKLLFPTDT